MKDKIYIIQYSTGEYSDYITHCLFATHDEDIAIAYVKRFNDLHMKIKKHYERYEGDIQYILDDFFDTKYKSWDFINNINEGSCRYLVLDKR